MYNRIVSVAVLFALLVSMVFGPGSFSATAQNADWTWVSPDVDLDGLPNSVEVLGWCGAVGCLHTDPQDADTDDDGLTDGEEQLFESDPTDAASPGIYVVYEDRFKTKEYYPWQQYGHMLIARGDAFIPPNPDLLDVQYGHGTDLDAVVVRRGTTFTVGGRPDATLQIDKSIGSLTTLNATRDPLTGKWRVSIPSAGTAGKYTLRLGASRMDLYVIFELPTPSGNLTQTRIDKFLYDDDRATLSDELAVLMHDYRWPGDPGSDNPPYTVPPGEEVSEGNAYTYDNQQFNRFLFEDYVMPEINGKSSQKAAIDALVARVDKETIFRNPHPRLSSWSVLHPGSDPRQQCSNIAALLTAFARSAGVPARPIIIDWRNSTFDHSTEIWLGSDWYVYRGYTTVEMAQDDDTHLGCGAAVWPACGTDNYFTRAAWGRSAYKPWHSGGTGIGNVLVLADEQWDGDGGGGFRWATWNINHIRLNEKNLSTVQSFYWTRFGWTSEPINLGSPGGWPALPPPAPINLIATPGNSQVSLSWSGVSGASSYNVYYRAGSGVSKTNGDVVGSSGTSKTIGSLTNGTQYAFGVTALGQNGESVLSSVIVATPFPAPTNTVTLAADAQALPIQSDEVQLGPVVAEYGVDTDGNGQYDHLVLEVEVSVVQAGSYWIWGQLSVTEPAPLAVIYAGGVVAESMVHPDLAVGKQIVKLVFDGTEISAGKVDGPYQLSNLRITDAANPGPTEFMNDSLADANDVYRTAAYRQADFETHGALLDTIYAHQTLDSDQDGRPDTLAVTASLKVYAPGVYSVAGSLYDGQGRYIGRASWTGNGPAVTLRFGDVAGRVGPYVLRDVTVDDAGGRTIDSVEQAYRIEPIAALSDAGQIALAGNTIAGLAEPLGATKGVTTTIVAGNLQVGAQVSVSQSGMYALEAWLSDSQGNLIDWASSQPVPLAAGLRTLLLTFDGATIRSHNIDGPYTVVALKVLSGASGYTVFDKMNIALTTPAYSHTAFNAPGGQIVFADSLENGAGQWQGGYAPWEFSDDKYFSAGHGWYASDVNASLKTVALDFSHAAGSIVLKFQSAHKFGGSDKGYVEASTDGSTWDTLALFNSAAYWSTQFVDVSAYANRPQVYLRFRLASSGGASNDAWAIDDVLVVGQPDSDGDGLTDADEVNIYGTDPHKADTDNDGLTDYQEIITYRTDPKKADTDGDGLKDGDEIAYGTDPHDVDTDNDGLSDGDEVHIHHTNPKNVDTDGDGDSDGDEVVFPTDPLDPNSRIHRVYIIAIVRR